MAEFDKFGSCYEEILNKNLKFSGLSMDYFAGYKAACVSRSLGSDFTGSILDYGCGIGLLSNYLTKFFDLGKARVAGYDISNELLKEARKNAAKASFTDNLENFTNGEFDVIIMANVLHHVNHGERQQFLKDASRYLKKEGRFFIFEHNPYNPITVLIVKFSSLDKGAVLLCPKETEALLNGAGFDIIENRYIVFFPKILSCLGRFEPMLHWFPMGAQCMCVGKLSKDIGLS